MSDPSTCVRWLPASAFVPLDAHVRARDLFVVERETGKIRLWTAFPGYSLPHYYAAWAVVPDLPDWILNEIFGGLAAALMAAHQP